MILFPYIKRDTFSEKRKNENSVLPLGHSDSGAVLASAAASCVVAAVAEAAGATGCLAGLGEVD